MNFRPRWRNGTVPTLLVDGWNDYPLPGVVDDYAVSGAFARGFRHLRIGAGGHLGGGGEGGMTEAPLEWFDTWLQDREGTARSHPDKGPRPRQKAGSGATRRTGPLPAEPTRWVLPMPGASLASMPPETPSEPDRYRFDPADPTPSSWAESACSPGAP